MQGLGARAVLWTDVPILTRRWSAVQRRCSVLGAALSTTRAVASAEADLVFLAGAGNRDPPCSSSLLTTAKQQQPIRLLYLLHTGISPAAGNLQHSSRQWPAAAGAAHAGCCHRRRPAGHQLTCAGAWSSGGAMNMKASALFQSKPVDRPLLGGTKGRSEAGSWHLVLQACPGVAAEAQVDLAALPQRCGCSCT